MDKQSIISLKQICENNNLSLSECFQIACEDAYRIRFRSYLKPDAQRKIRANDLAFPFSALWIDLKNLLEILNSGVNE